MEKLVSFIKFFLVFFVCSYIVVNFKNVQGVAVASIIGVIMSFFLQDNLKDSLMGYFVKEQSVGAEAQMDFVVSQTLMSDLTQGFIAGFNALACKGSKDNFSFMKKYISTFKDYGRVVSGVNEFLSYFVSLLLWCVERMAMKFGFDTKFQLATDVQEVDEWVNEVMCLRQMDAEGLNITIDNAERIFKLLH